MNILYLFLRTVIAVILFWGVALTVSASLAALPSCNIPATVQLPPGFQMPIHCKFLNTVPSTILLFVLLWVIPALFATFVLPGRLKLSSLWERVAVFIVIEIVLVMLALSTLNSNMHGWGLY